MTHISSVSPCGVRRRFVAAAVTVTVLVALWSHPATCRSADQSTPPSTTAADVERLLKKIERRYDQPGFSAEFTQSSTLKAMQITDTARGHAVFKRPAKMRWTYEAPDPQEIITDGTHLWLYRPEDNQVAVGAFPAFFGDGKGASFLSNIKVLREKFTVTMETRTVDGDAVLRLKPLTLSDDIERIELTVSAATADIYRIATVNSYGDETVIELSHIKNETALDDSLFTFNVPDNIDIIQLSD